MDAIQAPDEGYRLCTTSRQFVKGEMCEKKPDFGKSTLRLLRFYGRRNKFCQCPALVFI